MAKDDKSGQQAGKSQDQITLSIKQLNAIDLLVTGKTDQEVGEAVGVARQTVCRWRLHNPLFQAQLNIRRKEVWSASADRIRSLVPSALTVLEKELLGGGQGATRTALAVLKMVGMEGIGEPVGETDVWKIIRSSVDAEFTVKLRAIEEVSGPFGEIYREVHKEVVDKIFKEMEPPPLHDPVSLAVR